MDIQKIKKNKSIQELLEFGIINIDKPSGPTSFDISDFVRKKLGLRKTSHFGTLDPKVTGVLPLALNRACKLTGYFLGEDKEYVGIMSIHQDISLKKIEEIIKKKFLGVIKQTPPVKSRVKRQEREREIKRFDLIEKNEKNILFEVECQGGTYIRKLLDDLGKELGIGAHMLELRRKRAGIFLEENIVNLYDFEKAVDEYEKGNEKLLREIIIPGEIISELHKEVQVKEKEVKRLLTGKPIFEEDLVKNMRRSACPKLQSKGAKKDEVVSVFCKEKFIGMYKITNEKEIFARGEFVMQDI